MFAKLLKYEWKASARILGLLSGCALGLGCISAVILRLLTTNWVALTAKDSAVLLMIPAFLFLFASFMGIILYSAGIHYILLYRFYKSRFTDEGYLMFTLPVKTHQVFLSGAVNMLIWSAISFVVVILSIAIALILGPAWPNDVIREIQHALSETPAAYRMLQDVLGPGYSLVYVVSFIITIAYGIIGPLSIVVVGATITKKNKVLVIIALMFGLSTVYGTINGIISGAIQLIAITTDSIRLFTTLMPLVSCIFPLAVTIGGYFLSIHLMKNKLNLP